MRPCRARRRRTTVKSAASRSPVRQPAVCKAAGKTILYGVVPLASTEQGEDADDRSFPIDDVKTHLVSYLKPSASAATPSWAGQTYDATVRSLGAGIGVSGMAGF